MKLSLAPAAHAESLELLGYAGMLGEWELTAPLTLTGAGKRDFAGPLKMRHVGVCTQDGPEEKTGELRLRVSGSTTRVSATLLIEATQCSYTGDLRASYDGMMNCPDRRSVPLTLWIK